MGKENKSLENFGVEKFMNKVTKLMVMGIMLAAITAACAKAPAVTETSIPTGTPLPSPTPAPTATEDPFEGLSECRTWQEAVNCPITENDFRRISDYVKANYKFSPEALRVNNVQAVPMEGFTSYISIHLGTEGEKYTLEELLSKIGKPFFFNLESNPPRNDHDNLVAIFPVNNADGSLGTYTIIMPPILYKGNFETAEEQNKEMSELKFNKMPYLPPVYNIGRIPENNILFRPQGSLITEIIEDTKNQENGERKKMFDEWKRTGIIPNKLEEIPLLSSDFDFRGFPLDWY